MRYEENNKFDYLVSIALLDCGDKDLEMFEAIDDSNIVLSNRLTRRVRHIIYKKSHESMFKATKRISVRLAVAMMIIMSLLLVTLMSISATREAIWNAIVEWYEDYITVRFEDPSGVVGADDTTEAPETTTSGVENTETTDDSTDTEETGDNVETTEPPEGIVSPPAEIEEVRKPTYLPAGVEEEFIHKSFAGVFYEYYLGDDLAYLFNQMVLRENDKYVDSETAKVSAIEINGFMGTLVEYTEKEEIHIIWTDSEYVYRLTSSELDIEELIKVACSVE
ncbi:MAG: DUF4367 domain-containing protein [Clostridia bacterium]|nr:DUF4367 domain-containing protein [Clostridia bacterium]